MKNENKTEEVKPASTESKDSKLLKGDEEKSVKESTDSGEKPVSGLRSKDNSSKQSTNWRKFRVTLFFVILLVSLVLIIVLLASYKEQLKNVLQGDSGSS